jgi:hypothetical protein
VTATAPASRPRATTRAALPLAGRGGLLFWGALGLLAGAGCSRDGAPPDDTVPATRGGSPSAEAGAGIAAAPEDGQGSVRVVPDDPVPAGSRGTWAVEWIAGPDGLPAGGGAVLQISPFWGWSEPQARAPRAPGYTTVSGPPGATLSLTETSVPHALVAHVVEGRVAAGETLRFVYGDTTAGGSAARARVDTYAEQFEELLIKTDGNADGFHVAPPDPAGLRILAGPAALLAVASLTVVPPGEPLEVRVTALDARGNRTGLPEGDLVITARVLPRQAGAVSRDEPLRLAGRRVEAGEELVSLVVPTGLPPGLWRLEASLGALAGRNDLVLSEADSPFAGILWGDLHCHSGLSDGTGAPADLYAYARDVSGLDVCAVTDHDAHGLWPLAERGAWEEIREATRAAHEPGRFVALLGYEWTNWTFGHRNVYFPGADGEVFAFTDPASDTPEELWEQLGPWNAQTIPHHPGGGPVPIDWSIPSDPARETVVEICSIHGSSEAWGVERGIYRPVRGASVRDALSGGHRLGILASGDTHDGHPGRRSAGAPANGLAAFRAAERTRAAVFEALRERRVYGTSGPRILLACDWGGVPPGTESSTPPDGPVRVRIVAPEPLQVVELVGPGGILAREWGGGRDVEHRFRLTDPPAWVYVRAELADGEVAWDSPWWSGAGEGP